MRSALFCYAPLPPASPRSRGGTYPNLLRIDIPRPEWMTRANAMLAEKAPLAGGKGRGGIRRITWQRQLSRSRARIIEMKYRPSPPPGKRIKLMHIHGSTLSPATRDPARRGAGRAGPAAGRPQVRWAWRGVARSQRTSPVPGMCVMTYNTAQLSILCSLSVTFVCNGSPFFPCFYFFAITCYHVKACYRFSLL